MATDSKIVELTSPRLSVTQKDLEEFLLLTRKLHALEITWREKHRSIAQALRLGAQVEPGIHEAFLCKLVVR